jgi:hypothetical protein
LDEERPPQTCAAPALIAAAGERAGTRFFEFFTANMGSSQTLPKILR